MQTNSQSTTLNLFLINQLEKEQQMQRMTQISALKNPYFKQVIDNTLPQVSSNKKWANTSIQHNLQAFLRHNDLPDSQNVLNDHSVFENAPVIWEGWLRPSKDLYCRVNPRRQKPYGNMVHHAKFEMIFSVCKFDKNNPICVDREGRILDGSYRMYAAGSLYEKGKMGRVYVRVYDFE
ncbi:hypothetical protein CLV24_11972 [Pontibacter ummariensis]|uniref:Uncharacterized protein n=1 Tax=Pontibacter ummariensis TaxID=1610492 RepID=A0A239IY24_9BACT|nr:hypothetical protein [Pontibacter ummariensis]PRY09021.1 hypothetical protein CLV24_11972 [Pontibacter ummariensis]SNS98510.1 hypothetical protein SAMN06296052_11972 [Pontibacter ummariensis]